MSSDGAPDSLVSAWQQQQSSGFRLVPADFARNVRADVRKSRRWLGICLALCAFLVLWSGAMTIAEVDPIMRLGAVLTIAGLLFSAAQIGIHLRRVRAARFAVDRASVPSLAYARAYLTTRREIHSGPWLWWRVILLFPGPPIFFYGGAPDGSNSWLVSLVVWTGLLVVAVFVTQRGAARSYDRLLRELDDIERQSPVDRFMAAHEQWKDE